MPACQVLRKITRGNLQLLVVNSHRGFSNFILAVRLILLQTLAGEALEQEIPSNETDGENLVDAHGVRENPVRLSMLRNRQPQSSTGV